jgi:hypothetical protein
MSRCGHRWVDPLYGKAETTIGPFACLRPPKHRGPHALLGPDGSFATWLTDGTLLLAAQNGISTQEHLPPIDLDAEPDHIDVKVARSSSLAAYFNRMRNEQG